MGTRSLTHIKEAGKKSKTIITLYRQFDGYPEGHGKDLFDFTYSEDAKLVNGYGGTDQRQFNGMGCFACQLIAHLKNEQAESTLKHKKESPFTNPEDKPMPDARAKVHVGGFYIYPPNTKDAGQEFEYLIYAEDGKIKIDYKSLYGTPKKWTPLTEKKIK